MGNSVSIHNHIDECIICWESIDPTDKVTCIRCNITLHAYCEENDRTVRTRQYCKCPHCQGIGTLGICD